MTSAGEAPNSDTVSRLLARLREELPRALPSALTVDGPSPTAGNDLYEAFLFSLVLKAARSEGYDVSFADSSGRMPTEFRLRRSPGRLSTGTFTHAILTLPNTRKVPLEVHTGVVVIGKSKVAHEADVLVLRASSAQRCRQLRIGRQFLGLDVDLSAKTKVLAATETSLSVVNLLEGRSKQYEVGVLPGRKPERDMQERFAIALRSYRQGR
jgi:hypothetical protein